MPCRSTKYPSGACAIHRFVCTTGHLCHVGLQSVCHGLAGFNLQFSTGILKCVPGEFHLGYVMTSS